MEAAYMRPSFAQVRRPGNISLSHGATVQMTDGLPTTLHWMP